MIDVHPLIERYVTRFEKGLRAFDYPDRDEAVGEIRNHIVDASMAGRPIDAVVESLGPPEALARAYAAELLLDRQAAGPITATSTFLRVAGLVAFHSFASFPIVGVLGVTGAGFSLSGAVMILIGILEQIGIHLPGVQMSGMPPIGAVVLGGAVLAVGLGSIAALRAYIRFILRSVRKVHRTTRPASTPV